MYSRSMGKISYPTGSRREPSYRRDLRVPPNYHGTAIGTPPPDGVPPAAGGLSLDPSEMNVALDRRGAEGAVLTEGEPLPSDTTAVENTSAEPSSAPATESAGSFGGLFSGQHFPFGHGLGYEELLILGLILFLLKEDEGGKGDSDLSMTLLLLGALLFFG